MTVKEMVTELCASSAPAGFEDAVSALIHSLAEPYADEIRRDVMGNLFAYKRCGRDNAKLLMFDAHIDETGLIVTGYDNGFLRFAALGGLDLRMLPAREVKLLTPEPVYGVISVMPIHVLSGDEADKIAAIDNLYIDAGMTDEQVREKIPLGTPGVFAGGVEALREGSRLCGKALDGRAGAAMLIKVMEYIQSKPLSIDVCAMFSVQEETGLRGAVTGAYGAAPDYCVVVDAAQAHTPDSPKESTYKMGGGAVIGVGPNMNRKVTDLLRSIADDREIPYQIEVLGRNSGTNARAIQVSRNGVAMGLVSYPLKYMHSPVETLDLADAEAIVRLLAEFAVKIGEGI